MIKLRVEWHHHCPSCGTRLVVDFLNDPVQPCECPWCGTTNGTGPGAVDADLRRYLAHAVEEIEATANNRLSVAR
ncbi:MAG: hypothetical protein ACP5R5_13200 [Armatimonadota bacterium]